MVLWLLLSGCLERITGEAIPLDPKFYAAVEEARGSEAQGGGASVPFFSVKTDKVSVKGIIQSDDTMAVDIDIRVPDPSAPGGMKGKGKILLERPGEFELTVPLDLGELELQAFQDLDSDGPNAKDPFAEIMIEVGKEPVDDIILKLVVGARGAAPTHQEIAPDQSGEMPKGVPENPDPFGGVSGNRIELSGILECSIPCPSGVDLDLFSPDEQSPGGRTMIGKMKLQQGEYVVMVPDNFGPLILEAFVDFSGDGPGVGDLMGVYPLNPVIIGSEPVQEIHIQLEKSSNGKMPMTPPPSPQ